MKRKIVSAKNLPLRLPVTNAVVAYLLLDKFNAPEWLWALIIAYYTIVVIIVIHNAYCIEQKEPMWKE